MPGDRAALEALDTLRTPEGWLTASSSGGRFASLFARDALIAALQVLPVDPSVAEAALERLGRELGRRHDPLTEEQPGKVLHEARDHDLDAYVAHGWPVHHGRLRYYGSVDAGPWFLVVVAALARAGHDVRRFRDAGGRVAAWLTAQPMPLSYRRGNPRAGLQHQGWRDVSWDLEGSGHGVVDDEGAPLRPPVALAQVQALAWRALSEAAAVLDPALTTAAERARAAFATTFLVDGDVPEFATHAGGVVRAATSDLGQVLWTGVLERPAATVDRLLDVDLTTAYGVRTLSTTNPSFRPDGYHTGAVWPFDSWLAAGGLDAVAPGAGAAMGAGVLDAVGRLGRYPELYVVDLDGTVHAHPEACALQAWTVGAVVATEAGWDGRAWATG